MSPRATQREGPALLAEARAMAERAGALLRGRFATDFAVEHKGEVDLVTEVDRAAQELVASEIRRLHPGHGILAEEGLDEPGTEGFLWVVDPLDGTTNYAHRFPVFAVSIAVLREGEPLAGVVYNPMSGERFEAARGDGARVNGRPIRVSEVDRLSASLLGTGFPYDIRRTAQNNLDLFARMAVLSQGIRRCGSAALDLCFVACGRFDGFWELNLKPWDVAAGALIVREAGGAATDFEGRPLTLDGSRTLASNGLLHPALMGALAGQGAGQGDR